MYTVRRKRSASDTSYYQPDCKNFAQSTHTTNTNSAWVYRIHPKVVAEPSTKLWHQRGENRPNNQEITLEGITRLCEDCENCDEYEIMWRLT